VSDAEPFQLHPRLAADTVEVGRLPLCRVLLMNESRFPWVILVPERPGVTEIYQLEAADQRQLIAESSAVARCLAQSFRADKMNIAALGNQVPQLHLHHVVRQRTDEAWPSPVWGRFEPRPWAADALAEQLAALRRLLAAIEGFRS
jgi:diadenosine tetraphosphate (Ap4A) HIT family hydrolase